MASWILFPIKLRFSTQLDYDKSYQICGQIPACSKYQSVHKSFKKTLYITLGISRNTAHSTKSPLDKIAANRIKILGVILLLICGSTMRAQESPSAATKALIESNEVELAKMDSLTQQLMEQKTVAGQIASEIRRHEVNRAKEELKRREGQLYLSEQSFYWIAGFLGAFVILLVYMLIRRAEIAQQLKTHKAAIKQLKGVLASKLPPRLHEEFINSGEVPLEQLHNAVVVRLEINPGNATRENSQTWLAAHKAFQGLATRVKIVQDHYWAVAVKPDQTPMGSFVNQLVAAGQEVLQQDPEAIRISMAEGHVLLGAVGHASHEFDLWGDAEKTSLAQLQETQWGTLTLQESLGSHAETPLPNETKGKGLFHLRPLLALLFAGLCTTATAQSTITQPKATTPQGAASFTMATEDPEELLERFKLRDQLSARESWWQATARYQLRERATLAPDLQAFFDNPNRDRSYDGSMQRIYAATLWEMGQVERSDSVLEFMTVALPRDSFHLRAFAHYLHGQYYLVNRDRVDSAIVQFAEGLKVSKAGGSYYEGVLYGRLGQVFQRLKSFDRAAYFYKNALTMAHQNGKQHSVAAMHNNLGAMYYVIDSFPQAKFHSDSAFYYYQKMESLYQISPLLNAIGTAFSTGNLQEYNAWDSIYHAYPNVHPSHQQVFQQMKLEFALQVWEDPQHPFTAHPHFQKSAEWYDTNATKLYTSITEKGNNVDLGVVTKNGRLLLNLYKSFGQWDSLPGTYALLKQAKQNHLDQLNGTIQVGASLREVNKAISYWEDLLAANKVEELKASERLITGKVYDRTVAAIVLLGIAFMLLGMSYLLWLSFRSSKADIKFLKTSAAQHQTALDKLYTPALTQAHHTLATTLQNTPAATLLTLTLANLDHLQNAVVSARFKLTLCTCWKALEETLERHNYTKLHTSGNTLQAIGTTPLPATLEQELVDRVAAINTALQLEYPLSLELNTRLGNFTLSTALLPMEKLVAKSSV